MLRTVSAAFAITVGLSSVAAAQDVCSALREAYDHAGKAMSLTWAEGIGDNSAPRATTRAIETNNYLIVRQINLTLLIENKCPVPKSPAGVIEYSSPALACATARVKGQRDAKECDMKTWTRQK